MKLFLLMCVFALFIASCGDSSSKSDADNAGSADNDIAVVTDEDSSDAAVVTEGDGQTAAESDAVTTDADVTVKPLTCADFKAGLNSNLIVNGEESKDLARSFILTLPKDIATKKGWPVIFSWHGVGDTADNFVGLLSGQVDNAEMPFILVTPEDADYAMNALPPKGVDWDVLVLNNGSIEAEFYDAIMKCIDENWGVDKNHVHMTGFSAGSIAADSIGVLRGEQIASIFTYSGAYFSNAKNTADLGTFSGIPVSSFITWPEMKITNKYTQALMHGAEGDSACTGPDACDKWGANGFYINFNHMSRFDANYLTELGHNVIICNHGLGHTNAGLSTAQMIKFFKDHPLGTETSPYKTALPAGYPDYCKYMDKPGDDVPDTEVSDADSVTDSKPDSE